MTTNPNIQSAVEAVDFGEPTARKTGRNPQFPYVPVIIRPTDVPNVTRQEQLVGLAFRTRSEAIACAEGHILRERQLLAARLADPRFRALREAHGLPREM